MIDFSKPVETDEDPPRPVRVLATDVAIPQFPIAVVVPPTGVFAYNGCGECRYADQPRIRNVAPPKPIIWTQWVALYADGCTEFVDGPNGPFGFAGTQLRVEHIQWMSDGSPVPGEDEPLYGSWEARAVEVEAERDKYADMVKKAQCEAAQWKIAAEREHRHRHGSPVPGEDYFQRYVDANEQLKDVEAQRDQWREAANNALRDLRIAEKIDLSADTSAIGAQIDCEKWKAETERQTRHAQTVAEAAAAVEKEIERMRPVVEAAVAWAEARENRTIIAHGKALFDTVRAYQSKSEPVKSCDTCQRSQPCVECVVTNNLDMWEPKQ